MTADYPATPMLDKQAAAREGGAQAIGEFLDWLSEQGVHRMVWREWTEEGPCPSLLCTDGRVGREVCAVCRGTNQAAINRKGWVPDNRSIETLLADFFEIDLAVVEQERRAILAHVRAQA